MLKYACIYHSETCMKYAVRKNKHMVNNCYNYEGVLGKLSNLKGSLASKICSILYTPQTPISSRKMREKKPTVFAKLLPSASAIIDLIKPL